VPDDVHLTSAFKRHILPGDVPRTSFPVHFANNENIKLFRRLLNASILNSMIVYRSNTDERIEQLSFRIQLIEGLFVKNVSAVEHEVLGSRPSDNTIHRQTEIHFISKFPPTAKKCRPQRKCVLCQRRGRRRETVNWCDACNVGLH
jgi:hypothetical protein